MTRHDSDLGDCTGFYKCDACGFRTAQGRRCPNCDGEVICDAE